MPNTWLINGSSRGLGLALAPALSYRAYSMSLGTGLHSAGSG